MNPEPNTNNMNKLLLIAIALLWTSSLHAFKVEGRVEGLPQHSKVYLYTTPPGQVQHKWSLSRRVDSALVDKQGTFRFEVPNADYGRLWYISAPRKPLKYFFSKDEDISFSGTLAVFGIHEDRQQAGRDQILMQDIMLLLEKDVLTPSRRRMAVEWLKRHAAEDVAAWALAYFYITDIRLTYAQVDEILATVPPSRRANPYYKLVEDRQQRLSRIQPGKHYSLPTLKNDKGQTLSDEFYRGHPLLIFSCRSSYSGNSYSERCRQLSQLATKYPQLRLLFLWNPFQKEEYNRRIKELQNDRLLTYDLSAQSAIDPLAFNICDNYGCILVHENGQVLSLSNKPDRLEECLRKNYDPHTTFTISGYVEGLNEGTVDLFGVKRLGKGRVIDSALIENGHFHFYGQALRPEYVNISIRNTLYPVPLFLENADIELLIEAKPALYQGQPTRMLEGKAYGSPLYHTYFDFLNIEKDEDIYAWIKTHSGHFASFFRIYALANQRPSNTIEHWLKALDRKFTAYPEYQEILEQIERRKRISTGVFAPAFTLPNQQGDTIALAHFRGKYVLLDFWASWCGPCRMEIPNLKKAWQQFHPKGLEIVSISIDYTREAWYKALQQEQMPWTQLFSQAKVNAQYQVDAVPFTLLLDPQGKIIALNLRGEKLLEKLKELF